MTQPIVFKADFTRSDDGSPFGTFVYDIQGMDRPGELFKLIPIKPGLFMTVCNHDHAPIPEMDFEIKNAPVVFSYILSGTGTQKVHGFRKTRTTEFSLRPLTHIMGSLPGVRGKMAFGRGHPMICVDLKIDRQLLNLYLDGRMDGLPKELHHITTPESQFYLSAPLGRQLMAAAREIVTPPDFKGITLDLFYESRALDLLSLQLEALTRPGMEFSASRMGPGDLERIRHARNLLVADLKNPPTISALSRQCGVNEFKLKKGFKQVFNTTIFSHLQKMKMEKAWHLIEQGRYTVTEAASEVGYTNISHFSAAFRKHFFINPGALKKAGTLTGLPLPGEPGQSRSCCL